MRRAGTWGSGTTGAIELDYTQAQDELTGTIGQIAPMRTEWFK